MKATRARPTGRIRTTLDFMPINQKKKPKVTPPSEPEKVPRPKFRAYIAQSSHDYISAWQDAVRVSPQIPSNGQMIDQLVAFALLRGFIPKQETPK